ncbi:MAG: UDP-2,3-diacylglucosamine diphosphatase [Alphaproteobacteria bacterium]|nr:UDP-2,3-diacylglucosamine diphosphatase [Alphaproteobacteria bacterium]MBV9694819.1 UDP-2,3-diacylglucosamine diphosphatase [Alphaproteobacteria bacterium]
MQKVARILAEAARHGNFAPKTSERRQGRDPRGLPPLENRPPRAVRRHRTLFISDIHLGTRGCKADLLADFLAHNDCEVLYLVGDIVDGWQFKRWYWSEAQDRVVREVLRKVDEGTEVIYVPGNHDEFLRDYIGRSVAGIAVVRETVHETAQGVRLLVLHGDQFDGVIGCAKWLAHVGDRAYSLALRLNDGLHAIRRWLGLPYWSLSAYLKRAVKNAVEYVSRYEEIVARAAAQRGVDGVVCGHIHHAEMRRIGDILYLNDGDWVESCSALAEDAFGNLEILRWAIAPPRSVPQPAHPTPAFIPA